MHIEQFRLANYSSFADTDWIKLAPRLNVVVGLNNSGKSALLAALTSTLPAIQHRNDHQYLAGDLKPAAAELDLSTSTAELRHRLIETGMTVRTPSSGPRTDDQQSLRNLLESDLALTLKTQSAGGGSLGFRTPTFADHVNLDSPQVMNVRMSGGRILLENAGAGNDDTVVQLFTSGENPSFFYFTAQRFNVASTGFAVEKRLRSDATNLPAVLAYLSGNYPGTFREIEDRVREIIPSMGAITVSTEENNFKILVWPTSGPDVRELAFDLANSGTGVSQAIAILTAVVMSAPSVIVIDEINSYLHPAATKQLLQILTTFYPKHQYIVSTHSSDVMSFPNIDRLLMVEKSNFTSSIRTVSRDNLADVRSAFRHLGISMTDVLGADRIVWVEGATEELVFPDLLRRAGVEIDGSIRFAGVAATGDFTKRGSSKKAVINLYAAATSAVAPLVEGASFLLDRETLSDEAVEQILRQTDKRLVLLRRRCLECYAINPSAIATLINSEIQDLSLDAAKVEEEIARLAPDRAFGAASKWTGSVHDGAWLKRVDAPKLLANVFGSLTKNRLGFQKTIHTPRIIAATPIEELKEVVASIRTALRAADTQLR